MDDTFFNVPEDKIDRFLPNHGWDPEKKALVDITKRTDARRNYRASTLFSGGGGLVSTAMDYLKFCEMLRAGGEYNGVRLLGAKTINYMVQDHASRIVGRGGAGATAGEAPLMGRFGNQGVGFGLGFSVTTDPVADGVISSAGEYAWGGAAGTVFWIDPVEELIAIGMIQLMGSPWPLRSDMKSTTYQAITELAVD